MYAGQLNAQGRSRVRAAAFVVVGLAGVFASSAASATPGELLPAFDYHFWTAPLPLPVVEGSTFTVVNPGVDVSLNPQPLPPFPDPGTKVDLSNPGDPVYTSPPGAVNSYVIDWGMSFGGSAVSFTPPVPTPGDPNNFVFNALGPDGAMFNIAFQIAGPISPGSYVELNPQPLPPFPNPGFSFVQLSFSTLTAGDPMLSFQMSSGGTPYGFLPLLAPVPAPEPATLALLGLGLAGLGYVRRRRAA